MKRGIVKCTTPRERAELARKIRDARERLGFDASVLRVRPEGAFSIAVEGDDDVFDRFFERVHA